MSAPALRLVDGAPSGAPSPSAATLSALVPLFLTARDYAPASRKQRRNLLTRFARTVGDIDPATLTTLDLLRWWDDLADLAPATRKAHHGAVGDFLHWCRTIGIATPDLTAIVRRPRVGRPNPRTLTAAQVAALRSAELTPRERLVTTLMVDMGLRAAEVGRLRAEDIDRAEGVATIHGKGGHFDLVPVPPSVLELVPAEPRGRLVPVSADSVSRIARRALRRVGVEGHSGHSLRRTFGTELLAAGAPVTTVQRALRHQSLTSTEHYLRRASVDDVRDAMVRAGR